MSRCFDVVRVQCSLTEFHRSRAVRAKKYSKNHLLSGDTAKADLHKADAGDLVSTPQVLYSNVLIYRLPAPLQGQIVER